MLESCFSNVTLCFYQKRTQPCMFSEECFDFFRGLYLFSEPNNYCFDRVRQRQLAKCNWRNTATALRTLVKSHKCLKETEPFAKSCSSK